jgi:hypothetical protein
MSEELITSACFKEKTLDGQLYDILVAIDSISATLPNGNQIAEIQNGELVNLERIDAGEF